jgi:hypothetical protein
MQKASLLQYGQWIAVTVVLLGMAMAEGHTMAAQHESQSPIRLVDIRMEKGAQNQFVDQMRKFAQAFGFTTRIRHSSPKPDDILFQMWRFDVKLIGGNVSNTGAPDLTFGIGFYRNRPEPVSPEIVDRLAEGLKLFVGQIAGVTFSERNEWSPPR